MGSFTGYKTVMFEQKSDAVSIRDPFRLVRSLKEGDVGRVPTRRVARARWLPRSSIDARRDWSARSRSPAALRDVLRLGRTLFKRSADVLT